MTTTDSQNSPRVQVKTDTIFGQRIENVTVDSNQFDPISDFRFTTLHRLALPARFEHLVADVCLWIASTTFLTSVVVHGLRIGLLSMGLVGVVVTALLIPVFVWALWLNACVEPSYKSITGIRVLLVLIGLVLGVIL